MGILEDLQAASQARKDSEAALKSAAYDLALLVERVAPEGVELPRGYRVVRIKSNVGWEVYLEPPDSHGLIDGNDSYLHGDFHAWVGAATHDELLQFAEDVRDGWLDELRDFLRSRTDAAVSATSVLSNATV